MNVKILSGYALFERSPILIRGYVFFVALLGLSVAYWTDTQLLMTLSAFLFGAYCSPMLPIWRDVQTDDDRRMIAYRQGFEKQFKFYYWLALVLLIAMSIAVSWDKYGAAFIGR